MNSIEILDAVKEKYGLASDSQAAKKLGIGQRFVSKVRRGEKVFGADTIYRAGELLNIEAGKMACWAMAERAKNEDARRTWQAGFINSALLPFLGGIGGLLLYILCKIARQSESTFAAQCNPA